MDKYTLYYKVFQRFMNGLSVNTFSCGDNDAILLLELVRLCQPQDWIIVRNSDNVCLAQMVLTSF